MPKRAKGLTAIGVKTFTTPGLHADGDGLYLQVTPTGFKSWVLRYQIAGRRRDMGLGPYLRVLLAAARQKALNAQRQIASGLDPLEEKRAQRSAARLEAAKVVSFRECAERYIAVHRSGWRNPKHAAQWPATLETYVYPTIGDLTVADVDVALVLRTLEPIWTVKPETASRVRGRVEAILDWATARELRKGENPARWKGHLENLLPARSKIVSVRHHPALPYAEMAAFMADLSQQTGIAAQALQFAILTGARTSEATGATWDELDLSERLWTVPATRMKSGREHRVPLSEPVIRIIHSLAVLRHSDFVFPGHRADRPLSNMALLMLLRRLGRTDLTTHGFRSSFRDWAAEQTNFPHEVCEMALGHVVGDKVERAYRRGDLFEKRRDLAEAWAEFCCAQ